MINALVGIDNGVMSAVHLGLLILAFFHVGCAQQRLIVADDELSIRYEYVFRKGETSKYSVPLSDIPNVRPVPTTYTSFNGRQYLIRNTSITSGETVMTVKVATATPDQFRNIRILHLEENDMMPSGYQWVDCTLMPRIFVPASEPESEADKKRIEDYNKRLEKYMPDPSQKLISCDVTFYNLKVDEYFAVVLQTASPPTAPFTKVQVSLDSVEKSARSEETIYRLSVKNIGEKAAGEVNLRSDFDYDSRVNSVKPSQGRCQRARFGSSDGSMVCHLGPLAAGATATIEFTGVPIPHSGKAHPSPLNELWSINVAVKEKPEDPVWPTNWYTFEPLRTKPSN